MRLRPCRPRRPPVGVRAVFRAANGLLSRWPTTPAGFPTKSGRRVWMMFSMSPNVSVTLAVVFGQGRADGCRAVGPCSASIPVSVLMGAACTALVEATGAGFGAGLGGFSLMGTSSIVPGWGGRSARRGSRRTSSEDAGRPASIARLKWARTLRISVHARTERRCAFEILPKVADSAPVSLAEQQRNQVIQGEVFDLLCCAGLGGFVVRARVNAALSIETLCRLRNTCANRPGTSRAPIRTDRR